MGLPGTSTRPPAVAGAFYPRDPEPLRSQVFELLAEITVSSNVAPKALIAPHAGYVYSGRVAAAAFATLRNRAVSITRVVLIGPAHYVHVSGIAAPTVDAFMTPIGSVPVDVEILRTIDDLQFVTRADAPHAPEHSLEVELPFLQTILASFKVVPLVVGDSRPQDVALVLRRLWGGAETLIVVSSDLSHYHNYETARRLDLATAVAIEHGHWASLGPNQACGCLAVAGLLVETERRNLKARRLALCNSGDTAGSRDQVVGYGAWLFRQTAS
ncbi:MAG: AmmeMemoRadiSam system protein B [Xanthobacteraceae bacterium]